MPLTRAFASGGRWCSPSSSHIPVHIAILRNSREIQLVLFKTGLLLGIRFLHGVELVAVQAPTRNIGAKMHWSAWARDKTAGKQLIGAAMPPESPDSLEVVASSAKPASKLSGTGTSARLETAGRQANGYADTSAAGTATATAPPSIGASDDAGAEPPLSPSKLKIPQLFMDSQPLVTPVDPRTAASSRGGQRSRPSTARSASMGGAVGGGENSASGGGSGGMQDALAQQLSGGSGAAHDPRLKAALDFKENKSATYTRGALQGSCNAMAMAEVAREFVLPGASHPPNDVRRLHFDALVIAEGEWSTTCNLLGITKAVDKFATAIGLIVNLCLESSHPSSLRSFVATGVAPQLVQLSEAGLQCENLEYLKGETQCAAAMASAAAAATAAASAAAASAVAVTHVTADKDLRSPRALAKLRPKTC